MAMIHIVGKNGSQALSHLSLADGARLAPEIECVRCLERRRVHIGEAPVLRRRGCAAHSRGIAACTKDHIEAPRCAEHEGEAPAHIKWCR